MQAEALAVGAQPLAQGGPLADESLVGDLGALLADGDEPRIGQGADYGAHRVRSRGVRRQQLSQAHPAPGVLGSLAQLR